ncbi:MAG: hypothetical protein H5T86_02780 [Armatimonadetes bacterium]|nr:hypothetical protein [Armatimonadota bacterium]
MTYPQYRYVTIYLRVQEPDGDPVRGAAVYIDGEPIDGLTAGRWYRIDDDGPPEWQGWLHNWAVHDLAVRIDRRNQVRELDLEVAKDGWGSRSTTIRVRDSDPEHMYVRVKFTLGVDALAVQPSEPEYLRPATR